MANSFGWLLTLAIFFTASSCSAHATKTTEELYSLYLNRDYFELEKHLADVDRQDPRQAFFEGQLDAAFLRDDQADLELHRFLNFPAMEADWRKEAWWMLGMIYLRHGNYQAAEQAIASALAEPAARFTAAERIDAEQDLALAKALRVTPAQDRTSYKGPSTVNASRGTGGKDYGGMLYIDFKVNGFTEEALFDTGAAGNLASESFARRHKLHLLPGRINVTSSIGQEVSCRLGLADEVRIGNMVFHHVVFHVLADKDLDLSKAGFSMGAVVGLPLILPMERIRYNADISSLEIGLPAGPVSPSLPLPHNLAFDGLCPLVNLQYHDSAIPFLLDTGSDRTQLFARFGERFPQVFEKAKTRTDSRYGIGSEKNYTMRILPEFGLSVGVVSVSLHDTAAYTEDMPFFTPVFGFVGEDFLAGGFELDFRQMRFSLQRSVSP